MGVDEVTCTSFVPGGDGAWTVTAQVIQVALPTVARPDPLHGPRDTQDAVGRSVERVFDLTNLSYELDRSAATRLLALWRDEARRTGAASPPETASDFAAPREWSTASLRARFGALSERIQEGSVTSRSDRESAGRRDLRSR